MKFAPILIAGLGLMAGCAPPMTLEEARAACTKQGGFLVVIHTQKVTTAGIGDEKLTPGQCVSSSKFDAAPPAPAH